MFTLFFRGMILYAVMILVMRALGKRQLGQFQPYEFAMTILLAATLLIGACTPAMEIYRGICHIAKEGTFCLENEEPYTLADRPVSLNFETQNCENKLFFTYFAK